MKKKNIFTLLLAVLLLFVFFKVDVLVNADDELDDSSASEIENEEEIVDSDVLDEPNYDNLVKGQLRCPPSDSSGKCVEIKDNYDRVIEARVTERFGNNNEYEVTKVVSKVSGTYNKFNVKFLVKGPEGETFTEPRRMYIIIIFDKSNSLTRYSSSFTNVRRSAVEFSNRYKDHHLALIVFASNIKTYGFQSAPFTEQQILVNVGSSSHIEKALHQAYNMLSTLRSDDLKHIIILGDGQYWYKDDTCRSWKDGSQSKNNSTSKACGGMWIEKEINNLKKINNLTISSVLYKSSSNASKAKDITWIQRVRGKIGNTNNFDGRYYKCRNDSNTANTCNNLASAFGEDYAFIDGRISSSITSVGAKIQDVIGDSFIIENDENSRYRELTISSLSNTEIETDTFQIKIDDESETGWHSTNNGYTFQIPSLNVSSNISPEVYWKHENKTVLDSCSQTISEKASKLSGNQYYTKNCYQGSDSEEGFSGSVNFNSEGNGTHKFNLKSGNGFSVNINLENRVTCEYSLNKDADGNYIFNNDYQSLVNHLEEARNYDDGGREYEYTLSRISDLNSILETYIGLTNDLIDFTNYKNIFETASGNLSIKYKNKSNELGNSYSDINLVGGDVTYNSNCAVSESEKINNRDVFTKRICSMAISKKITSDDSCIDIFTLNTSKCDDSSSNSLIAGDKIYPSMFERGGYISLEIENIDYFGKSIVLNGEELSSSNTPKCEFDIEPNDDVFFRQVELDDPFLQIQSNNTRNIGKNYKDDKYDFTHIINNDTWNNTFDYRYRLSKVNIDNIKKDTEILNGSNSYIGTDCNINSENKYICSFIRNYENEGDNLDFFTRVDINT